MIRVGSIYCIDIEVFSDLFLKRSSQVHTTVCGSNRERKRVERENSREKERENHSLSFSFSFFSLLLFFSFLLAFLGQTRDGGRMAVGGRKTGDGQ